jgi:hypothetical protein
VARPSPRGDAPRQRDARERALCVSSGVSFSFTQCPFDHPKLQNFELNFNISKQKSGRGIEELQLLQRDLSNGLAGNLRRSLQNSRLRLLFKTALTKCLVTLH